MALYTINKSKRRDRAEPEKQSQDNCVVKCVIRGWIATEAKDFYLLQNVQKNSWVHPVSCLIGSWVSSLEGKATGA